MKKVIPTSEIPQSLIEDIAKTLQRSTVALMRVFKEANGQEKVIHIGSGTLVSINNIYGILTVHHVANELRKDDYLGLTVGREDQEVKFTIPEQYLYKIDVGVPEIEGNEYGPDLSFIIIPNIHVGTIKATKYFFPLMDDRLLALERHKAIEGMWCVCGSPEVMTLQESTERFDKVLSFCNYCGIGGIPKHFENNDFDYSEILIDYKQDANIPYKFNGVSGGGFWQVLFTTEDNVFKPNKYILSGTVFWQSSREGDFRTIRCHGRKSIYQRVIDTVQSKYK